MKNLGSQTKTSEESFTNRLQDMEEKISRPEYKIEEMDSLAKENVKSKNTQAQHIKETQDTMRRLNFYMKNIDR